MSPDSATRLGSAKLRAMPFCSSALISTSIEVPLVIMRAMAKPNGEAPEITPAATSGKSVALVGLAIGRFPAGWPEPILVVLCSPKRFHCTPRSRLAVREISTKRTSSMTCCGDITETELMMSGLNWRAMVTALSRVVASTTSPDSMMRPLTEDA